MRSAFFRQVPLLAVLAASAALPSAYAFADPTPDELYAANAKCAAAESSGFVVHGQTATDSRALAAAFARQARFYGSQLGRTADDVAFEIAQRRRGIETDTQLLGGYGNLEHQDALRDQLEVCPRLLGPGSIDPATPGS
ncbi:MAG: hypothetical protein INR65_00565 [Gluconacetobacter diazotrophicus]|nr:hypothetical protein [Gluconacetobacter diazotrophicus]